jgi:hypothetical protein
MGAPWPNFFIVGAAKAGTTSLHRYMNEHPQVFMSPVKEPHFFDEKLDAVEAGETSIAEAEAEYRKLFAEGADATIRGESSPAYLWREEVPERIHEHVDDPRFLACLRDPVERAYSDYLMGVRRGSLEGTFADQIQRELDVQEWREVDPFVERGRYHEQLERYVDTFGEDAVHVILLDELKTDPLGALEGIAEFLRIDVHAMASVDYETVHNPYGVPKNDAAETLLTSDLVKGVARLLLPERVRIYLGEHLLLEKPDKPPMDPEARRMLEEIYAPELDGLERLLDRDLSPLYEDWTTRPNPLAGEDHKG